MKTKTKKEEKSIEERRKAGADTVKKLALKLEKGTLRGFILAMHCDKHGENKTQIIGGCFGEIGDLRSGEVEGVLNELGQKVSNISGKLTARGLLTHMEELSEDLKAKKTK